MFKEAVLNLVDIKDFHSKIWLFCCVLLIICHSGCISVFKQEQENDEEAHEEEEDAILLAHLQRLRTMSTKLFQLTQAIQQMQSCLSTALRGDSLKLHIS